jgi:hypothetical protein
MALAGTLVQKGDKCLKDQLNSDNKPQSKLGSNCNELYENVRGGELRIEK